MLGFLVSESTLLEFRIYLINAGLSKGTTYRTICRMKKFLRHKKMFSREKVSEWTAELLESDKKATANQYIKTFKHFGRFSKTDWTKDLKLYKEDLHIPNTFSNQEIIDFLSLTPLSEQDAVSFRQWTVFWTLCAYTGARTGEILGLTINNVDFGRKGIILQKTKTGTPRAIPLVPHIFKLLNEYVKDLHTQHLFPRRNNRNSLPIDLPVSSQAYIKDFKTRLNRLGIKRPLTPYNFRHTAITRWLNESDLNLFEVKRIVGHKKTATTERYYSYGGFDKLISLMKTDPLVHSSLTAEEQFEYIKEAIKKVDVNNKYFEKEVSESGDEVTLKIKLKKKPN